jgi:hypothetical protein
MIRVNGVYVGQLANKKSRDFHAKTGIFSELIK